MPSGISGNPPVFVYTADHVGAYFGLFFGFDPQGWQEGFQEGLLDAFLEAPAAPGRRAAGVTVPPSSTRRSRRWRTCCLPGSARRRSARQPATRPSNGKLSEATLADIEAAAQRFGALPASARHAWLAAHLAALRAGAVTLAQLP